MSIGFTRHDASGLMVQMNDIQNVTSRIAWECEPDRIIPFGSCAGGTAGADRDVDLLVVLPFEDKAFCGELKVSEN